MIKSSTRFLSPRDGVRPSFSISWYTHKMADTNSQASFARALKDSLLSLAPYKSMALKKSHMNIVGGH
jgi:hypothetical protein